MKNIIKNIKEINIKELSRLHIFLIVALIVFLAYLGYTKIISDTTAPVVTCDSNEIVVSVEATDKELMKGVTAVDNRSGNVTNSLIIESISSFADGERIIVYAAVDKRGNVGRAQRTLRYMDYEAPRIGLTDDLRYPMGGNVNFLKNVTAESTLDGDLTDKVKYSMESNVDMSSDGKYSIEYRVVDSTGTVSYLPVEIEIYNPLEEKINVELNEYLIYLEPGSYFNEYEYYNGASSGSLINVNSNVNVLEEGVYTVEYTVSDGVNIGKSQLIVVVTA